MVILLRIVSIYNANHFYDKLNANSAITMSTYLKWNAL